MSGWDSIPRVAPCHASASASRLLFAFPAADALIPPQWDEMFFTVCIFVLAV